MHDGPPTATVAVVVNDREGEAGSVHLNLDPEAKLAYGAAPDPGPEAGERTAAVTAPLLDR